jgi:putative nucleotidyltransferase with HDIG domain
MQEILVAIPFVALVASPTLVAIFATRKSMRRRTAEALAMAVEAKDQCTSSHLLRVRIFVAEIGRSLGLDESEIKALVTAAYLHDVGKLAVPEQILNKPGKLSRDEFETMKIHPVVGAEILERTRFPHSVAAIVRAHHERWDGSGYPDGLAGEQIPIGARILAAVDAFDALVSDRPYRPAMTLDEAMALIVHGAGTQFDPAIVGILNSRYKELDALAHARRDGMRHLNTDIRVTHGAAPAAGLAEDDLLPAQDVVYVPVAEAIASAAGADDSRSGSKHASKHPAVAMCRRYPYQQTQERISKRNAIPAAAEHLELAESGVGDLAGLGEAVAGLL